MVELTENQQALLAMIYDVVLDPETSEKERQVFLAGKNRIEWGHNFNGQMNEILSNLTYITPVSPKVFQFAKEARKRMILRPATGGTTHGFW